MGLGQGLSSKTTERNLLTNVQACFAYLTCFEKLIGSARAGDREMYEKTINGPRSVITPEHAWYPKDYGQLKRPPKELYIIGNGEVLTRPALAIVGARKATPYGISTSRHFGRLAARERLLIVSGGARGCDRQAHEAALEQKTPTVAFLGGGLDRIYPRENYDLFQRIVNSGGALVSENPWDFEPKGYTFRERNRLIAGMAAVTLIVEAGLPSGTFSTADAALTLGKEVFVIPGAITSLTSRGANELIFQGAYPVVDDETFLEGIRKVYGLEDQSGIEAAPEQPHRKTHLRPVDQALIAALDAEVLTVEALKDIAEPYFPRKDVVTWVMVWLAKAERDGLVSRYPGGRYGPCLRS